MQIDEIEDRARLLFAPSLAAMTVREAIALMVRFYEDERVDDADIDNDGDMLLAQWGRYGADGGFIFDIARQLIGAEQDAEVWQLHLRCAVPADDIGDIGADDVWCDVPADVPAFLGDLLSKEIIERAVGRYEWTLELEHC